MDGTTFYRWEREAKAAMREALSGRPRRAADRKDEEIARLRADLDKKRLIIAEVVEENLALKRQAKGSQVPTAASWVGSGSPGSDSMIPSRYSWGSSY